MKKFLLVLSCLALGVCAKAAEYEISTALSSPYGMFSTFSVFGDAVVSKLWVGAYSVDNTTPSGYTLPIFKPLQETSIEAANISFGGNLNVERDLFLTAPNQSYGSVLVSTYSTTTASGPAQIGTFFDMDFNKIVVPVLYADTLITGPITIAGNLQISNLYTNSFTVSNGSKNFSFPQVRPDYGKGVSPESPASHNCGTNNQGHYYGAWVKCSGSNCNSDTCNGDNKESYTCPDKPENSKSCTDVREVRYNIGNIITKPYISEIKSFYRKCAYIPDPASGAPNCQMETYASGEDAYDGIIDCAGKEDQANSDSNSCIALCSKYSGGCTVARSCKYKEDPPTQFGGDCAPSGWEMGSGLECKDSYTRVMYKIYTCPANSDYTVRPDAETFSQVRDVVCASVKYENKNTDDTYCSMQFLTADF